MAMKLKFPEFTHLQGITGVYRIRNIINQDCYIGSSASEKGVYRRACEHFRGLITNKHGNRFLQFAFNKYGKENFVFELVEEAPRDLCLIREDFYIKSLNPRFNLSKSAFSPGLNKFGYEHAFSKEVCCVNTGECFGSYEEAARATGCTGTNVARCARKGQAQVNGYCFADPNDQAHIQACLDFLASDRFKLKIQVKCKKFVCVNDGLEYWKSQDAADKYSLGARAVRGCLGGKHTQIKGYAFCYLTDTVRLEKLKKLMQDSDSWRSGRSRAVLRSDGVLFLTMKLAAKAAGTNRKMIRDVCGGRRESINGYKFQHAPSQIPNPS